MQYYINITFLRVWEAEVDNHFRRWTFLLLPSQECTIYFIIPKLLSGKKRYVNGAGEEDVAF